MAATDGMDANETEDEYTDGDELNNYDLSLDDEEDEEEEEEEDEYDEQDEGEVNEQDEEIQDLSDLNEEDGDDEEEEEDGEGEESDAFSLDNKNETIRAVGSGAKSVSRKREKIYDDIVDRLCNTESVEDLEGDGDGTREGEDSFEELLSGFEAKQAQPGTSAGIGNLVVDN